LKEQRVFTSAKLSSPSSSGRGQIPPAAAALQESI
jgi:hypothetical protein